MSAVNTLAEPQSARFIVHGRSGGVRMSIRITPAGLLAIGGLVSSILLSTAVLVRVAVTSDNGRRRSFRRHHH